MQYADLTSHPPTDGRIYLLLGPSRRLIVFGLLIHGLALSGVVVLLLAYWPLAVTVVDKGIGILSGSGLVALAVYSARQSLHQAHAPVRMLCLEPDGQLAVLWADAADFHPVDLQSPVVILPWLVLLQGIDNTADPYLGPSRCFSLPILYDSLTNDAAEQQRQLRVWLRWRALPAARRIHPA